MADSDIVDLRRRGIKLARMLEAYVHSHWPEREEAAQVLVGAYEILKLDTSMVRGTPLWALDIEDSGPSSSTS